MSTADRPQDEAPTVSALGVRDLERLDGDIVLAIAVLKDSATRAFFANPGVTRAGKQAAVGKLLESRVHGVVARFVSVLCSHAGVSVFAAGQEGIAPDQYASSAIDLARAVGLSGHLSEDFSAARSLLKSGETRSFLADARVSDDGRSRGLKALLEGVVHPLVTFVAMFLFRMRDLGKFAEMAASYMEQVAAAENALAGELISAIPLSPGKVREMEEAAGLMFGKRLKLMPRVDGSLLGGVIVKRGDLVLDGTVDGQLGRIRRILLETTGE